MTKPDWVKVLDVSFCWCILLFSHWRDLKRAYILTNLCKYALHLRFPSSETHKTDTFKDTCHCLWYKKWCTVCNNERAIILMACHHFISTMLHYQNKTCRIALVVSSWCWLSFLILHPFPGWVHSSFAAFGSSVGVFIVISYTRFFFNSNVKTLKTKHCGT